MTKNRIIAIASAIVFAASGAMTAYSITKDPEVRTETHTITKYVPVEVTKTKTVKVPTTLPHCEYEDSDNCIWDGEVDGNGQGASFIAWEGKVYYLDFLQCEAPTEVAPDKDPSDGSSWAFCA